MKACVLHKIHDLRYEDHPDPQIKNPREAIVRVLRGGICGSDMHYYEEGGIGTVIKVREPLIIGHEGVGVVESIGSEVSTIKVGDMVVMRPARPCYVCDFCRKEQYPYCNAMEHLGSAARLPHAAGLFAEKALIHEDQAKVVRKISPEIAAFAEPLAVAYNGVRSAGEVIGKKVLVMGAGPIGALSAVAAQLLGAAEVAAVDVRQLPLDLCRQMGVANVVNSKENPDQIAKWKENRGYFDVMIEASGNSFAVADGMAMVKPWGTVSQVGMFSEGKGPTEFGPFTTKSITWRGVFRFYDEFGPAVDALEQGYVNPLPLLSGSFPASDCVAAIKEAMSPNSAKIQLVFAEK